MEKMVISLCISQIIGACLWVLMMKARDKKLKELKRNKYE